MNRESIDRRIDLRIYRKDEDQPKPHYVHTTRWRDPSNAAQFRIVPEKHAKK